MRSQKIGKMIGFWSFFAGMLLALVTAFVNPGEWASQVLIILGLLAGGFYSRLREEMVGFGVIYLSLSLAADSASGLMFFGPIISNIVSVWVRFLGPVVLAAFMVWGAAFLMSSRDVKKE